MSVDNINNPQCRYGLPFLLSTLVMLSCGLFSANALADKFFAFYYNARGELLQVEKVPDGQIAQRTLEDANTTKMVIPLLTQAVTPKISGNNLKMSRFATIAVYYTFQGTHEDLAPNVQAKPLKVEDLQWVKERTLATCVASSPTDPCRFPQRCHCMTVSCCCY